MKGKNGFGKYCVALIAVIILGIVISYVYLNFNRPVSNYDEDIDESFFIGLDQQFKEMHESVYQTLAKNIDGLGHVNTTEYEKHKISYVDKIHLRTYGVDVNVREEAVKIDERMLNYLITDYERFIRFKKEEHNLVKSPLSLCEYVVVYRDIDLSKRIEFVPIAGYKFTGSEKYFLRSLICDNKNVIGWCDRSFCYYNITRY